MLYLHLIQMLFIPKPKWSYQPSRIHVGPHPGAHRAHLSVRFGGKRGQGCARFSVLAHRSLTVN